MDVTTPARSRTALVTEELVLDAVDPTRFLRQRVDGPRGFWAERGGWIAHQGEVARLEARDSEEGDPFERIASGATRLRQRLTREGSAVGGPGSPLRFYGGFSFTGEGAESGPWAPFRRALFILPEIEVRASTEGVVLLGRALSDDAEARSRLTRRLDSIARELAPGTGGSHHREEAEPSKGSWSPVRPAARGRFEATVRRALDVIETGELEKVVVARSAEIETGGRVDAVALALRLRDEDAEARTFLFEPVPGWAFVGAAPETLFASGGGRFRATAVAGSAPRGADAGEDARLAAALLASEKDRAEHAFAVEDIVARLRGYVADLQSDPEPHILTLSRIHHLETRLAGRLEEGLGVLDVLARLHPTPAVGGVPRDRAARFLREEEGLERGWYAAPVGWFDLEGNGAFAPALRCALVSPERCTLYAGAGIVRASDPAREWEETEIKLRGVRGALWASSRE